MEYANCWGSHFHWFWIVPLLFMVLAFFLCRASWRAAARRAGTGRVAGRLPFGFCGTWWDAAGDGRGDSPGRILDRRYARGEITKEQYESMSRDIASRRRAPAPQDGA